MNTKLALLLVATVFSAWACGTSQPPDVSYQYVTEAYLSTRDSLVFLERSADAAHPAYRLCIEGNGDVLVEIPELHPDSLIREGITREQFQQLLEHFDNVSFFHYLEGDLRGSLGPATGPRVTILARLGNKQKLISCGGGCVGSVGSPHFYWLADQIDSTVQMGRWSKASLKSKE